MERLFKTLTNVELTEEQTDKLLTLFDNIKFALLPILSKSITFGVDQYNQFADLARRTNYSAMDNNGRKVIMLSDMGTSLIIKALMDTVGYLNSINTIVK